MLVAEERSKVKGPPKVPGVGGYHVKCAGEYVA